MRTMTKLSLPGFKPNRGSRSDNPIQKKGKIELFSTGTWLAGQAVSAGSGMAQSRLDRHLGRRVEKRTFKKLQDMTPLERRAFYNEQQGILQSHQQGISRQDYYFNQRHASPFDTKHRDLAARLDAYDQMSSVENRAYPHIRSHYAGYRPPGSPINNSRVNPGHNVTQYRYDNHSGSSSGYSSSRALAGWYDHYPV